MSLIRPLEREDLPQVAALYELVVRSGGPVPPPGLAPYFERLLLDHPWVDPEIPSLVYVDDHGSIVGFQGSSVRRARFDDRSIRIACAGQLVAHPDARHRGVGALLVRAYLHGPQDLTITDGATEQMRQIWTLLGGAMAHLECVGWIRLMRPWSVAAEVLMPKPTRPHRVGRRVSAALDAATPQWARRIAAPAAPGVIAEPLTPASLLENLPLISNRVRLCPAYDETFLQWLFAELAAVSVRGIPIAQLVLEPRRSRVLGWYVYYLKPGGISQVLQIAAVEREVGLVIDHLVHHAWSSGATALRGRVEPRLLASLSRHRCFMHYTGMALVHATDQEILGAIAMGQSLLTRLDGEWWMGHHLLDFAQAT